jgi:hypothetical protein
LQRSCLLRRELGLDVAHLLAPDLERLGEHVGRHLGRRPEERHGDGLRAGELAVERRHDGGGLLAWVRLEVHEAAREREDVAGGDGLGDELVGGGDEADVERAVEHEDQLGGARVRVRRVEPAGGVVDAGEGDAQRVEPRDLLDVGAGDHGACGAGDGARLRDDAGEEVVRGGVRLARESVHLQLCMCDVSV